MLGRRPVYPEPDEGRNHRNTKNGVFLCHNFCVTTMATIVVCSFGAMRFAY
jgi:hypothetical protein